MRSHCLLAFITLLAALLPDRALAAVTLPEDKHAAVVLAYHRIGEEAYPDTNLRIEQFEEHLRALKGGGYTVLPLTDIISAIKNKEELPTKTLAITFEGAYKSAFEKAMPLLIENGLPFTVFFATDHADADLQQHLSWKDLKSLARNKTVSFGLHPASYTRLSGQGTQDILTQINKARVRFRENLEQDPAFFSYPFGEYSLAYKNLIKEQGFTAALGLHSGTLSSASDLHALPRFSMTEIYGDIERFQLVTNALPFPVTATEPTDPYLKTPPSQFGFSTTPALAHDLSALSCYVSGQGQPTLEILSESRIELQFEAPATEPRTRINCTLPGPKKTGETPIWRWFSMLLVQEEPAN